MDEELWRKFLFRIEENIGTAKFSTWFEPLQYLGTQGKSLRIQVPNRFTREWLSEHYLPLMVQTARTLVGAEATIQFEVGGREPGSAEAAETPVPAPATPERPSTPTAGCG